MMELKDLIPIAISIVALLMSGGAIYITLLQTKIARHSNLLPIAVDMFREYRSDEFKDANMFVLTEMAVYCENPVPFSEIPENALTHVRTVSHFYDNIGLLIDKGIIDQEMVIDFMGLGAKNTWEVLEPFIRLERMKRGDPTGRIGYQEYFEDMISRVIEDPPFRRFKYLKKLNKVGALTIKP